MEHRNLIFVPYSEEKPAIALALRKQMTPTEKLLWHKLRRNQLGSYHFRRQQLLEGFIADFYCHAARLVIEVDGDIHAMRAEYDQERERILEIYQIKALRFSNEQVMTDIQGVLNKILINVQARTRQELQ